MGSVAPGASSPVVPRAGLAALHCQGTTGAAQPWAQPALGSAYSQARLWEPRWETRWPHGRLAQGPATATTIGHSRYTNRTKKL